MARLRDSRDAAAWRSIENDARRALADSERPVPHARRHDAADGVVDAARRLSRLLQRALVRIHRHARGIDRRRGLERHVPSRRSGARLGGLAASRSRPASPTRSNTGCGITTAPIAGCWAARCRSRDEAGAITRWFGTCTDIHEQKLALEEREVISQELSHRIKNIFAVISGLIVVRRARAAPSSPRIADDLRQRITALGRAHDFVRPHSPTRARRPAGQPARAARANCSNPISRPDGPRIAITGEDVRDRRSLGDAAGAAVPRTGDQRDQIWRAVERHRADHGGGDEQATTRSTIVLDRNAVGPPSTAARRRDRVRQPADRT